jgi:hypothetical protein
MNPGVMVEWFHRQGLGTIQHNGLNWVFAGPRVLQAIPYNLVISPPEEELRELLHKHKVISLRYSTPLQARQGKISYHVVTNTTFEIKQLAKKVRHDVSRGLEYADYEPIPFERLANEGWQLRQETLTRQGRVGAEVQNWWQRLCLSAKGLPGFEAWGSIHDGRLCAALLGFYNSEDRCFSILYQQSRTEELKNGVNNTLAFQVTNNILAHHPEAWIFYGLHSLDAPPSVDEFKFRMGFSAKPVRQRVVFNPFVAPLVNRWTVAMLTKARQIRPGNYLLAKAEGMLRFYLDGNLPLEQQSWPLALEDQRAEILNSQ